MDYQQLLTYVVGLLLLYSVYTGYNLKYKIYCSFRRRDKTLIWKWAKAFNGYRLDFEGGWYYVNLRRCILQWKWVGILPLWIRVLEFNFNSSEARDPETFKNEWESPQARKNLNKQEDIASLEAGSKKALGGTKVQGILGGGLMPIILVVAVVIVGYMTYQLNNRVDMLGNAINVLQQMMVK